MRGEAVVGEDRGESRRGERGSADEVTRRWTRESAPGQRPGTHLGARGDSRGVELGWMSAS